MEKIMNLAVGIGQDGTFTTIDKQKLKELL